MIKRHISVAVVVAVGALAAAGCGRSGGSSPTGAAASSSASAQPAAADFGSLKDVCHPGKPTSSPDQGVTTSQIKVGVFTDEGFTKNPEFVNTAKVFTSWCNANGGIDGRKIVADTHDTEMLQVVQQMTSACSSDFVLAGGGAALDGLAVQQRLKCLLPAFPGQEVMAQNLGAALQPYVLSGGASYYPYAAYDQWLMKTAYPGSGKSVGIITGDSPVTAFLGGEAKEGLQAEGGTVTYNTLYPPTGVSDWTPYAQAIKNKGVKGLVFYGDFASLAKLEQVLTSDNYKLDWIDANSNAYGPNFLQLAGSALSYQHNYADIAGFYPLEKTETNPATKQLVSLFGQYGGGAQPTLPSVQGFSAWLLFAVSAESCGNNLTRACILNAADKQTAWTGGGLQAPANIAQPDSAPTCYNVEKATPGGWEPASFGANDGAYRCGITQYKLKGSYPQPLTLADVGKSMSDVK